ncbi:MAG: hypothetical protein GXO90_10135 [FCB group bacterium]|nr:hypothetical protein [FCB group bacterium]
MDVKSLHINFISVSSHNKDISDHFKSSIKIEEAEFIDIAQTSIQNDDPLLDKRRVTEDLKGRFFDTYA